MKERGGPERSTAVGLVLAATIATQATAAGLLPFAGPPAETLPARLLPEARGEAPAPTLGTAVGSASVRQDSRSGGREVASAGGRSAQAKLVSSMLQETNRVRRRRGLRSLALSDDLCAAARAHAEDMLDRNYFDHRSPEGGTPNDRVVRSSPRAIVLGVRENISMTAGYDPGDPEVRGEGYVQRWMDSKGHRENLLNQESTHVGFAAASASRRGEWAEYAVQVLGVVAGRWDRVPPGAVRAPATWKASLIAPLEFFLDDLSHPGQRYADPDRARVYSIGGVPLAVSRAGGSTVVELPRVAPGSYRLLARLRGEEGYQLLRNFTVVAR